MKNLKAINILNQCIDQISSMTNKEFLKIKEQRGILNKQYNLKDYINQDVEIILPITNLENNMVAEEVLDYKIHIDYSVIVNNSQSKYRIKTEQDNDFYSPLVAAI